MRRGTLGSNRLKCTGYRWAPNLLKVGRLAPGVLKCGAAPTPGPRTNGRLRKKVFDPRREQSCAKVGAAGGPKLLKWGLSASGRGSNLLKSDRPLTSTTPGSTENSPVRFRPRLITSRWTR